MKKAILIIVSLLFVTSTVFPQSKVNINILEEYGGKMFLPNDDKPFTGKVFDLNENTGEKNIEGFFRKGVKNGKWTWWNKEGLKDSSGIYNNGLKNGIWLYWDEKENKTKKGTFRNGLLVDEWYYYKYSTSPAILVTAMDSVSYNNIIKRMDELNKNDAEHVDVVQKEFREDLRTLNLQFIGRGKHVRKTEKEIIANTNLINVTADSLADMIYIVQYNLDELDRNVSQRFSDVETDIADLEDDFNRNRRKTSQTLFEIQQSITLLRTEKAEEINQSVKEKVGKLVEEKRVKFIPYDDPPKPLTSIKPKYPEIAQEAGIEGTVIVQVFVDKKGRVKETVILKGIPNTGLDEAAIEAIRKTRFVPAKQRERPVGVWISIPVNFRLK